MRPDPIDGHPNRLIREISDLRCPYCAQAPTLIRTTERDIIPDDQQRWKAVIGCRTCRLLISSVGPTEQVAIDGAVSGWHWLYPQPIDVRDTLAIRPGRP